jgi:hypothetical protein
MHDEVYSDGVSEITVSGSMVRIDLMSLSPTERDEHNNPKPVFRQRLILPVEGFANSIEVMQKAFQELVGKGVVKRAASRPMTSGPKISHSGERPTAADKSLSNSSPNFR